MKRRFRLPWDPPLPKDISIPVRRDLIPKYQRWSWRNGTEWFWLIVAVVFITFTTLSIWILF